MKVVIKEKEHDYFSDYPQGWRFASGDPFKFPVTIGRYTCFIKRFEKKSPADISGWSLMQQIKDKFEPDLPRIYDIVKEEEEGKPVHYVFYEHIAGETLEAAVNRNADLKLQRLTDDLFKALDALHNKNYWFMDFCEKNIFCETGGRFFLIDLDSVQPLSQAPHIEMDGDKQYWALVLNFYKEQLGYTNLKASDMNGAMLNYLQMIFLVLRLKIAVADKRHDYKSALLYDNLPALLQETDPGVKDIFVRAYEQSEQGQPPLTLTEVKNFIVHSIILNDQVPFEPIVREPLINHFAASTNQVEPGQTFTLNWEVAHANRLELYRNGKLYKEIRSIADNLEIKEGYDGKPKRVVYTLVAANSASEKTSEPVAVTIAEAVIPEPEPTPEPEQEQKAEQNLEQKTEEISTEQPDSTPDITSISQTEQTLKPDEVIIPKIKPDPGKLRYIRLVLSVLLLAIVGIVAVVASGVLSRNKVKIRALKTTVTEGDTFLITGKNFPVKANKLQVLFNNFKGSIISNSGDTLRVLVPEMNTTTDSLQAKVALVMNNDTLLVADKVTVRKNEPSTIADSRTEQSTIKPDSTATIISQKDSVPESTSNLAETNSQTGNFGKVDKTVNKSKMDNSRRPPRRPLPRTDPAKFNPPVSNPDYPPAKSELPANIHTLVSVKSNVIANQRRNGTKDLQITVQNSSAYDLDNVSVEINYMKKNGKLLHKETLSFTKVRAHTSQTLTAPDDDRSKKVDFKIVAINSKQVY